MDELGLLCTFAGAIMLISLLSPLGYACCNETAAEVVQEPQAQQTLEMLSRKSVTVGSTSCDKNVWVEQLDWAEYQKMISLAQSSLSRIDAIGSKDEKAKEDALAKTGIPGDPGAVKAKDLFFMGPTGEQVMLYDVHKKRAVSPDEVCHLSNIVVDGKMSFATLVDETRFCASESCNHGLPTVAEANTASAKADRVAELDAALKANDSAKLKSLATADSDVKKAYSDVTGNGPEYIDDGVLKALSQDDKTKITSNFRDAAVKKTADLIDNSNPLNVVISDLISVSILKGAGAEVYMLPVHLVEYVNWLQTKKGADEIYMVAMAGTAIAGTASSIKSVATAIKQAGGVKSWWSGVTASIKSGGRRVLNALSGKGNTLLGALREGAKDLKQVAKIGDIGDDLKALGKADELESELGKLAAMSKNTETYQRQAGKVAQMLQERQKEIAAVGDQLKNYEKLIVGKRLSSAPTQLDDSKIVIQHAGGGNPDRIYRYNSYAGDWEDIYTGRYTYQPNPGDMFYESNIIDDVLKSNNDKKLIPHLIDTFDETENSAGFTKLATNEITNKRPDLALDKLSSSLKSATAASGNIDSFRASLGTAGRVGKISEKYLELKVAFNAALEEITASKNFAKGLPSTATRLQKAGYYGEKALAGTLAFLRVYGATRAGKMTYWGSRLTIFSMYATWLYNDYLRKPYFEADALTFTISKDKYLKTSSKEDFKNAYLETVVHKSALVLPQKGAGTFQIFSMIMSNFGGPELPQGINRKMNNLGPDVFIFDQMNPAYSWTAPKNTNLVTAVGTYWLFFANYKDNAGITMYEHPKYTGDVTGDGRGDTAMWFYSKNIDISGQNLGKTDWVQALFIGGARMMSVAGQNMLYGGLIFGVPTMLKTTIMMPIAAPLVGDIVASGATGALWVYMAGQYYQVSQEQLTSLYSGNLFSVEAAYKNTGETCSAKLKEYAGSGIGGPWWDQGKVGTAKYAVYATGAGSMIAHAIAGAFPPAHFVGLLFDGLNVWASYEERKIEEEAMNAMQNCMETDFEIVAQQSLPTKSEVSKDILAELAGSLKEGIDALKAISPEASSTITNLADYGFQILHLYGESQPGTVNVMGKELYDVHFQDANLRWIQNDKCQIQFCSLAAGGYACAATKGYFLLDDQGNVVLETPLPQMLSIHVDMESGYAGVVQKVVNINKADETTQLMDIYPDKVEIKNGCLKETLRKEILGLQNVKDESWASARIAESLGGLGAVQTQEAIIWPEGNELGVRFIGSTSSCSSVGLASIHHFPGAHLEFSRDGSGTIKIVDKDGKLQGCTLHLGSSGVISFKNGMIRAGYAQEPVKKGGTKADYSNVYHLFIYTLVSGQATGAGSEFGTGSDAWRWEQCTPEGAPAGTIGFRLKVKLDDPNSPKQTQWNDALAGVCFTTWQGQNGTGWANFTGDKFYYTTPDNQTIVYNNLKYDPATGMWTGTGPDGKQYQMNVERGPDGTPQVVIYDKNGNVVGGPIPLLWANGLGGSLMFNPDTGKISINNEFPFALNPSFQNYGGGGLGMITPGLAPWGGRPSQAAKTTTVSPEKAPNILAQLPWMPEGYEMFLFVALAAFSLMLVRIKVGKRK